MNYYNEFNPGAAAWLRELIDRKLIPAGDVDTRSITEVKPHELAKYTQCHFFAGIGGWSLALELAGWPADRRVWSGSAPCQPFSSAGKQLGDKDERHLWPVFFDLIRECRPDIVFGEQVANAIGKGWLDGISADLESENYACGTAVLGAHSLGAPHIRQRLYWVADSRHQSEGRTPTSGQTKSGRALGDLAGRGECGGLADSGCVDGRQECPDAGGGDGGSPQKRGERSEYGSSAGRLVQPEQPRLEGHPRSDDEVREPRRFAENPSRPASEAGLQPDSAWSHYDLIPCADGKTRRLEPGVAPLVNGLPRGLVPSGDCSESEAQASAEARVMRLHGYGNAIVAQVAAEFIKAYLNK